MSLASATGVSTAITFMTEVLNYILDEREFSDHVLENGLKCYFIRDPSAVDKFNVALTVSSNSTDLPPELRGLHEIAMNAIWRGSERYPGCVNFKNFVDDNEIKFEHLTACEHQTMVAGEIPKFVVEEYLDRIADMVTNPEITKESIEYTEMRRGDDFYQLMKNDKTRSQRITRDNFLSEACISQLFIRRDLVYRVRDFIYRNYCPSKMTLVLSGNMSIESFRQQAIKHFGWIPRNTKCVYQASHAIPFFCPSDENRITFARGFTRNDTKLLTVDFRLPLSVSNSSAAFIAYLLNTSRIGSLQHKLKSEGLIKEISAELFVRTENLRTLNISFSQTLKGSQTATRTLSLLMGFIELIKQMNVSENLFREAHEFFVCLQKKECDTDYLNHLCFEIGAGSTTADLRYPEIPHKFDPAEIKLCAESLKPYNCVAVVLSNEYTSAPVKNSTDYYLQYFTEEIRIQPSCDGLVVSDPDPLMAGCKMPSVEDTDLHLASPNIYLQSKAGEFFSTVKIGIKPAGFSEYSLLAQTLYAELINHKLWLVTNRLFDVSVKVDANTLDVYVKCPPESLSRIMFLVCSYLSQPIEDTFLEKFMELKQDKERIIDMWLSGDSETAYQPEFDEILKDSIDPAEQRQQLQTIRGLGDLPHLIKGEVILLFGGNAHPTLVLEAAKSILILQFKLPGTRCPLPTSRDIKRTISRKYFKKSSICKVFDVGLFSHRVWASLNLIRRVIAELLSNGILIGPRTSSEFTAELLHKCGRMWFVLRLSGDASELELERRLDRCLSEDLPQILDHIDEDFVRDFRDIVWANDVMMTSTSDSDEEMSFLWRAVKECPQDDAYFGKMRRALLDISTAAVRNTYTLYLSRERRYGTRTVVWRPRGNLDDLSGLELGALGVYRSPVPSGDVPSPKRLRTSNFYTELAEMVMKTSDIMDMLGLNDDDDE